MAGDMHMANQVQGSGGRCPHCGYCPHCGRVDHFQAIPPYQPSPWWWYPPYLPWWQSPYYTVATTGPTVSNDAQMTGNSGVQATFHVKHAEPAVTGEARYTNMPPAQFSWTGPVVE